MTRSHLTVLLAAAALTVGSLTGCESAADRKAEHDLEQAADLTTCRASASPAATPYGDGFPADWPFPSQTTVFNAEDRGRDGTIVTGISSAKFQEILAFMNGQVADAGYRVEKGETEEHDAEAEWSGNGFRGRWAIRESTQCGGETVIQVLSARS
jgi:hypothetical protein